MRKGASFVLLGIFLLFSIAAFTAPEAPSTSAPPGTAAATKVRLDVNAGPLDKALRDMGLQANVNISYEPDAVAGLAAPAVKGEYTLDRALGLVLGGTRLKAVSINENTIQIVRIEARDGTTASRVGRERDESGLEEITVTGTHIRGMRDTPSPMLIFSRADIDAVGANSIQQFLQMLTQNVGGASESTINAVATNGRTTNDVNGSSPNLRGLGASATLVLVNGHRVAPGNSDGSFVDISMIPPTAVERVEVLTDGASAIYGSDAVGGVVNIILRKQFDGYETRAQLGSVTKGTLHNLQIGQTAGKDWGTGSGLLTYQYSDQTSLSATSRDYFPHVVLPFALLPEQIQHSAFGNLDQAITDEFDAHADAQYSHRSTYTQYSATSAFGSFSSDSPTSVDAYGISLNTTAKLTHDVHLGLSVSYSETDSYQAEIDTPSPSPAFAEKTKTSISAFEANLDGSAMSLGSGPVRYAVGGQYRREYYGQTFLIPAGSNQFKPSRNVAAFYGEVKVPLLGTNEADSQHPTLEVTLADRDEHYSDFGSSNNPQVGAVWRPLKTLLIRGTFGTSFRAPLLSQLNPTPSEVAAYPSFFVNPGPMGRRNLLILDGGDPALGAEKATAWTLGFELVPAERLGLSAKTNFYHINFTHRISSASSLYCACDALAKASLLGPSVVNLDPTLTEIRQYFAAPTLVNPFNLTPADIGAIFDARYKNLTGQKTSGVDLELAYRFRMGEVQFESGVDGTYVLDFDSQFADAPAASVLNTAFNPLKLRLRARTIFSDGPFSGALYLNFANPYMNNNVTPNASIPSWTTLDAVASYDFSGFPRPLEGTSLSLSVINLTDRAPPFVATSTSFAVTYDGINANTLGRYISLRLQKRW